MPGRNAYRSRKSSRLAHAASKKPATESATHTTRTPSQSKSAPTDAKLVFLARYYAHLASKQASPDNDASAQDASTPLAPRREPRVLLRELTTEEKRQEFLDRYQRAQDEKKRAEEAKKRAEAAKEEEAASKVKEFKERWARVNAAKAVKATETVSSEPLRRTSSLDSNDGSLSSSSTLVTPDEDQYILPQYAPTTCTTEAGFLGRQMFPMLPYWAEYGKSIESYILYTNNLTDGMAQDALPRAKRLRVGRTMPAMVGHRRRPTMA